MINQTKKPHGTKQKIVLTINVTFSFIFFLLQVMQKVMFATIYPSSLQTEVWIRLNVQFKREGNVLKFWEETNTGKGKD